ncbi:hypothetical protein L596_024252 [Steinernema carpocapsae]|uniref:Protein kinase domain-containing protein n=1 Tax=Steinernema carpocapsae TaxID=34508 RepID=A0A4U5MG73_STECR|nr:hypothetical protein L596_024252 [Steinernema carpocapsae]
MGNAQGSSKSRKRRVIAAASGLVHHYSMPTLSVDPESGSSQDTNGSSSAIAPPRPLSSQSQFESQSTEGSPLRKRPRSILSLPTNSTIRSPVHAAASLDTVEEERTEDLRSTAAPILRSPTSAKFLSSSLSNLPSMAAESAFGDRERLGGKFYRTINRSIQSFRKLTSGRKRKRSEIGFEADDISTSDLRSACSSQTSLSGTQWPVPWIEAVFLPEFSVKSTISQRDFIVLNDIGVGSFGAVSRVCLQKDRSVFFAMKRQKKSMILSRNAVQQVKSEVEIHKSLSGGPFIARFYASFQSRSELFTVSQYAMGYGDMFTLWRDFGSFSEASVRIFAAEIAISLDYIHSKGVVYRDLKLENIVLDIDGHIQIVDFGMAKQIDEEKTRTICGTLQYMAPEIAQGMSYDLAVDWWSFGVLLHILFTNRYPFPSNNIHHHSELTFIDYHTPIECSKEFGGLLNKLLTISPEKRLRSFETLVQEPFFKNVSWDDVEHRRIDPYENIEKMKRCRSCNTLFDRSGSDLSGSDVEENIYAFDEHYQFDEFDYFNDDLL